MFHLFTGYKHIGVVEGICDSRPIIIAHRLEPKHFIGLNIEDIKKSWIYLTDEQINEALNYLEETKEDRYSYENMSIEQLSELLAKEVNPDSLIIGNINLNDEDIFDMVTDSPTPN